MSRFLAIIFASFVLVIVSTHSSFADAVVKRGTIKGISVKWTTGSVHIVKTSNGHELPFGNNFKTKRGPALVVFLGSDKPNKHLGRLKSIEGSQDLQNSCFS